MWQLVSRLLGASCLFLPFLHSLALILCGGDPQAGEVFTSQELALGSGRMFGGLEGPRPSPADMWLKQVYLPRMRASHPARRIVTPLSAPEQAA